MQQNSTLVSNPTMDPKAGESEPRAFHFQSLFGGVSNLGKAVSGKRRNIWRGAEHSLPADLGGHVLGSFSCLINVMGSSCNLAEGKLCCHEQPGSDILPPASGLPESCLERCPEP